MPIITNPELDQASTRVREFKPKRGLGGVITRKRRLASEALAEQKAKREEAERRAAKAEIERMKALRNQQTTKVDNREMWANDLVRTIARDQQGFMRSIGLNQGIDAGVSTRIKSLTAYTDFRRIVVQVPLEGFPARFGNKDELARRLIAIRGVMQHEIGHLRFSVPFPELLKKGKFNEKKYTENDMHLAWNLLEDQRMESLVVAAVPRIARYFTYLVMEYILQDPEKQATAYLLTAGRKYLPGDVVNATAAAFDAAMAQGKGIKDASVTWDGLVAKYKRASTSQKILDVVQEALDFLYDVMDKLPQSGGIDDHGQMGRGFDGPADKLLKEGADIDAAGKKGFGMGKDGLAKAIAKEKYGEGEQKEDKAGAKREATQNLGQSNHGDGSEAYGPEVYDLEDEVRKIMDSLVDELKPDTTTTVAQAYDVQRSEGLPDYPNLPPDMSGLLQARAQQTAIGMQNVLETFVTDASPRWHFREENGVIDPLAYRTKRVGDRNYRRLLTGQENEGLDVHVSMLCDVSGSMGGAPITALSEALYATGLACQRLGIGADFVLWSSDRQNYRIWQDGVPQPSLWPCMGGTDPTAALDDLQNHNKEGKSNHLVLIFTDGAWAYDFPSLTRWHTPERTIILIRYGAYDGAMQKDMGADKHIAINDVASLPEHLTRSLSDVLRSSGDWS